MPYDEELARMRAQMLANQDDEPPVFDDGARYLGQDPNMMPVGLFGRPKKPVAPPTAPPVNLQRRSILGLTPMPAELPAVVPPAQPKPTPQQIEQAVPQQQSTPSASSASPLQSLADKALNAPMSRRDVLQRAGQVALQQVVPMPSVTDITPEIVAPITAPLTEIAKTATPYVYPEAAMLKALKDMIKERSDEAELDDAMPSGVETFLKQADSKLLPAEDRKELRKAIRRYYRLENSDNAEYDDLMDTLSDISSYVPSVIDAMKDKHVIENVFDIYGMQESEIANYLLDKGFTHDNVADLLDSWVPGFDPESVFEPGTPEYKAAYEKWFAPAPRQFIESPKPKATKSKSKDK